MTHPHNLSNREGSPNHSAAARNLSPGPLAAFTNRYQPANYSVMTTRKLSAALKPVFDALAFASAHSRIMPGSTSARGPF